MIVIENIGGNPLGESQYELRINKKVIATFTHNRMDGLSACLKKASAEAEKSKWKEMMCRRDFGE